MQKRIASSPELTALYERERRAVGILRGARAGDRAPAHLRAAVQAQRPTARVRARRRIVFGGGLAGALAAVALALVLILPAGTPGAPSVSQAAALAIRGSAAPAPDPDRTAPGVKLGGGFGDAYFPDWTRSFGWRAVGRRSDRLDGRLALTVYYGWQGRRVAYTIVDAPALAVPSAPVTRIGGTDFRTLTLSGRLVVTWRRDGHTCVLSGSGISAALLRRLAAWTAPRG